MSKEINGTVYIVNPIIPPMNEWQEDSPGYYDFWAPAERNLNREIDEVMATGKPFKIVTPEEMEKIEAQ